MYVPAVGQGALAIECREDDKDLLQLLAHMNDGVTEKNSGSRTRISS